MYMHNTNRFEILRTSTFYCRGRALCNSLHELNETQASVRPTAGETYNEIENEPVSIEQYNL